MSLNAATSLHDDFFFHVTKPGLVVRGEHIFWASLNAATSGVLHYRALHGELHGAPWISPWRSVGVSMEVRGGPWRSVEVSMEASTELHGPPWRPLWSLQGPPRSLHGPPWSPMSLHGAPWRSPWSARYCRGPATSLKPDIDTVSLNADLSWLCGYRSAHVS